MAFLRTYAYLDAEPVVQHARVTLRAPVMGDYAQWAQLRSTSRTFLEPWEPTWPRDDLTRSAFRQRVRRYNRDMRDDYAYAFFIFEAACSRLVGGLTLSNIRRGVTQAAALGYWLGEGFTGQGHMRHAVSLAADFAFEDLRLHRLEAACLPNNEPSIRVPLVAAPEICTTLSSPTPLTIVAATTAGSSGSTDRIVSDLSVSWMSC